MTETGFEAARRAMVDSQLRTNAVNDPRVIHAFLEVPRERFVPEERRAIAYTDRPVPLGQARWLNAPLATGRLLTELQVRPGEHVLLIGAATGYAAALLAHLGATVVALDAHAAPGSIGGVTAVEGPLNEGWAVAAPYDVILIDGAVEQVPQAILGQLRDGGRLATGIVDQGVTRLALGRRSGSGFGLRAFGDAECVILPGFAPAPTFSF